jgi:phosphoribosylformylglycinamidine synthase
MESHNHPSYIEPYQGAATGVGGILRDVFCMGSRPIANLNALRFGKRSHQRTSYLTEYVVKGIGDYGNCIGVPTVAGNVSFDESYDGNCLVNAMTLGEIHGDRIFRGFASGTDNLVVYLGSATGRDGIHGATMASDSFESKDASERSAVQVGDPFTEKLLLEATLEVLEHDLVIGLQDMGAAGLTSSSFEMADRAGSGLVIDLDRVPVRTSSMNAYELLLSESQERMLMVVEPKNWLRFREVLSKWDLACDVIGTVTETGRVQAYKNGKLEVDIAVGPITESAPKYSRPIKAREIAKDGAGYNSQISEAIRNKGAASLLAEMLEDTGSKEKVWRQYDHHIGTKTVRGPDSQGAAVLWIRSEWADPSEPYLGVLTTTACNERYTRLNPRLGATHAVLKCARSIAAAGGTPLAITDCLNYGNPEIPEVMWEFSEGVDGISEACLKLDAPVVSGNVSLYNETDGKSIAPTPMIGMVGRMSDVRHTPKATIDDEKEIYLLCANNAAPEFGGSLAAKILQDQNQKGVIPSINWDAELEAMAQLRSMIGAGSIANARDVGDGGIATTAAKMVSESGLGLELDLSDVKISGNDLLLHYFGELGGAWLIAFNGIGADHVRNAQKDLKSNQLIKVGRTTRSQSIVFGGFELDAGSARKHFEKAIHA